MADGTGISWTDATWNPLRGCTRVSAGCVNCYAERDAARVNRSFEAKHPDRPAPYAGLVALRGSPPTPRWTGEVRFVEEHLFDPIRWRRPRRIFTNSMSDLFHESVPDEWIDRIVAVMLICALRDGSNHVFQTLTKRIARARDYLNARETLARVAVRAGGMMEDGDRWHDAIAYRSAGLRHPNLWWGTSIEDQPSALERLPILADITGAAVRFVSCEPLVGEVDLVEAIGEPDEHDWDDVNAGDDEPPPEEMIEADDYVGDLVPNPARAEWARERTTRARLAKLGRAVHWVIAGCESGPGARPCDVQWLRALRDDCQEAGVAFFLKQAAENVWRIEDEDPPESGGRYDPNAILSPVTFGEGSKRKPGAIIELPYLDGHQHAAFPAPREP